MVNNQFATLHFPPSTNINIIAFTSFVMHSCSSQLH